MKSPGNPENSGQNIPLAETEAVYVALERSIHEVETEIEKLNQSIDNTRATLESSPEEEKEQLERSLSEQTSRLATLDKSLDNLYTEHEKMGEYIENSTPDTVEDYGFLIRYLKREVKMLAKEAANQEQVLELNTRIDSLERELKTKQTESKKANLENVEGIRDRIKDLETQRGAIWGKPEGDAGQISLEQDVQVRQIDAEIAVLQKKIRAIEKKSKLPSFAEIIEDLKSKKGTMVEFDRRNKNKHHIDTALEIRALESDSIENLETKLESIITYIDFAEALAQSIDESKADNKTKKNLTWLKESIVILKNNKGRIEVALKYIDPNQIKHDFEKILTSFDMFSKALEAIVEKFKKDRNYKMEKVEIDALMAVISHYNELFSIKNAKKVLQKIDTTGAFFANLEKFIYLPLLDFRTNSSRDSVPEELQTLTEEFIDVCERKNLVVKPKPAPAPTPAPAPSPAPSAIPKNFETSMKKGGDLYEQIRVNPHLLDVAALAEHDADVPDDQLTSAVKQIEDIMKAIPADKDVVVGDFDSVKKEIIDPIKPVFEYLTKISKDKQKPKQKLLLATLIRFARRIGLTLEKPSAPEPKPAKREDIPKTTEGFEADMGEPDKSKLIKSFVAQLTFITSNLRMGTKTIDLKNLNTLIDAIPLDADPAAVNTLKNKISAGLQACANEVPPTGFQTLKDSLINLAARIGVVVTFKEKDPDPAPTPKPEPTKPKPKVKYIPASEADIVLDNHGKEGFNKTPGFNTWLASCIKTATQTYSTTELPDHMKKTLTEWHDIYKVYADRLQKLQKYLFDATPIDGFLVTMFTLGSSPEDMRTLKQKAFERIGYDIFEGSNRFQPQIDTLIDLFEKSEAATKEMKSLEQKFNEARTRFDAISDTSKEITESDFDKAIRSENSPEYSNIVGDLDTFIADIEQDYSDLVGSLSEDTAGGATTFYTRWKHRQESKNKGAVGKMTFGKRLWNRVASSIGGVSFKEESLEIHKLNAKIAILRRHRLVSEKGANVTKVEASANMKRLIDYIAAKKAGTLDTFPEKDKKIAEPAYTELFNQFAREKYSYKETADRDAARITLQDEIRQEQSTIHTEYSEADREHRDVIGDVWHNNPFSEFKEEIQGDLLAIDVKKASILLNAGDVKIDSAAKLTTLTRDYPALILRKSPGIMRGVERDMDILSANVLQIATTYLGEKKLLEDAAKTIYSLHHPLSVSIRQYCELKNTEKETKVEKLTKLRKVLDEYVEYFDNEGDDPSLRLTNDIINQIDRSVLSL